MLRISCLPENEHFEVNKYFDTQWSTVETFHS